MGPRPDLNLLKKREAFQINKYDIDALMKKQEEEAKKKKESRVAQPPRPIT